MDVIAIFDIGKTNKKFLLFNAAMRIVYQDEQEFTEIIDDDGFPCDDIDKLETWMKNCLSQTIKSGEFNIRALNFTTYGATLIYLDASGKRLTPVYNYLKPMPEGVLAGFYESYGGVDEFCRKTASPALGMLNSGLQALWLKRKKPDTFSKVSVVLHLPQYLSQFFTHNLTAEFTSIGCHTAMWDFDSHQYHHWLKEEGISVPMPVPNDTVIDVKIDNMLVKTGIGIHDSSASLVPYFMGTGEQFILLSTGTWCIFMNPFNKEPLTVEQLRKDSLCYMSIKQQQVKSSRLFLGHIHDVNVELISKHFGVGKSHYKTIKTSENKIVRFASKPGRHFFKTGIPENYVDIDADLNFFLTFDEAYHRLMADLVDLALESLKLVIPADDQSKFIYIAGGFARNEIFTNMLAARLPDKKVFTSVVDNTTALGAAMVIYEHAFGEAVPEIDLGMKAVCSVF
jgi:sugar (pentulose or hexulose) kinase